MELISEASAAALGRRLRELEITGALVRQFTEPDQGLEAPLVSTRTAKLSPDAAALATRLLFCGEELTPSERQIAVGALPAPLLHLRVVAGLYIMSDYLATGAAADAVMGGGATTSVLWRAARPAQPVEASLDLGCGAGTLALLLAAHSSRVLGTDINPRAVQLARLNAALNGIRNAEFRAGDLFAPVNGERFNLIVSQPPYYPGSGRTFLHGGERGDEIARRVVEGVPRHLASKGRALILSSWPEDSWPLHVAGHHTIALTTNRRELAGADPGLVAIQPGAESFARHQLSPECWGDAAAAHLDGFFRGEFPAPTHTFTEEGVRWAMRPLFGLTRA